MIPALLAILVNMPVYKYIALFRLRPGVTRVVPSLAQSLQINNYRNILSSTCTGERQNICEQCLAIIFCCRFSSTDIKLQHSLPVRHSSDKKRACVVGYSDTVRQWNYLSSYHPTCRPDLMHREFSILLPLVTSQPTCGQVNTAVRLVDLGRHFAYLYINRTMLWKAASGRNRQQAASKRYDRYWNKEK